MRVLIVKLGALGDAILALPAARLLRASLPAARIAWLIEERHSVVLEQTADVDDRILVHADRWRRQLYRPRTWREIADVASELRAARFDLAIDLQGLWKSGLWARLSGARVRVGLPSGSTREGSSRLLMTATASVPPEPAHVVDLYLAAARTGIAAVGGTVAVLTNDGLLPLTAAEEAWADRFIARHGLDPFVILNPGAAWETKRWSPDRFGHLARGLVERAGVRVCVVSGPGEEGMAAAVVAAAAAGDAVVASACGVRELAALASRARLFVAGDTGPYHLARARGVPTLGLFGPTDPVRNGPREFEVGGVVWGKVACSPCNSRSCPTQVECMAAIGVDAAVAKSMEILALRPANLRS